MAKKALKSLSLLTVAATMGAMVMPLFSTVASAATLNHVTVALSPETVGADASATVTFTTFGALVLNDVIEVTYDGASFPGTGATDLVVADITAPANTTVTQVLPGYVKLTVGLAGISSATSVSVGIGTLNTVVNPAKGNYGFSVTTSGGTDHLAIDMGAGLAYVGDANDVIVDAVVPPVIDMEVYNTGTGVGSWYYCHLGVLSISKVSKCSYKIGTATNNVTGMEVDAKGVKTSEWSTATDALVNGAYTIPSDTSVNAGTEGYGFYVSNLHTTYTGATYFVADAVSTTAQTAVAVPLTETKIFESAGTVDTINNNTGNRVDVMHVASMSTSTAVGSYNMGMVYTAYTK